MTFGICTDHLPLSFDGELKKAKHSKWIARRRMLEKEMKATGDFHGIDLPGRHDVLFGRGTPFHQHTGNIQMRQLVDYYVDGYRPGPRFKKKELVDKVISSIQNANGRFLERRRDGWWVEVSTRTVHEKVTSSFRTTLSVKGKAVQTPEFAVVDNGKRSRIDHKFAFCTI
jgi:hypothetical protein